MKVSRPTIDAIERGGDCGANIIGRLADALWCELVDDLFCRVRA